MLVAREIVVDAIVGTDLHGHLRPADSGSREIAVYEAGKQIGKSRASKRSAGGDSFVYPMPPHLYDGTSRELSIRCGDEHVTVAFVGDPRLRQPRTWDATPPIVKRAPFASFAAVTLRNGWILEGSLEAPPEHSRVELNVDIDGNRAGTIVASRHLGVLPDGSHRLGFSYVPGIVADYERPHLFEFRRLDGKLVGATRTPIAQQKPYHDPSSFLAWAFHHRLMRAPFSVVDDNCLSYFDWLASYRCAASDARAPHVSILMPALDASKTLGRAIDSVLAQSHTDWDLLIVDDGSATALETEFARYADPRIAWHRLANNEGQAACRNYALERARGPLVAFLDADNSWDPRYLAVMAATLDNDPESGCAYCGQFVRDPQTGRLLAVRMGAYNPSLIENENYIDLNCLMAKKDVLLSLGGFNPSLRALEDWDLILRLAAARAPLFVPVVLSSYSFRESESVSTSRDVSRAWNRVIAEREARAGVEKLRYALDDGVVAFWNRPRAAPKSDRRVSIVIPSYNVPQILRLCVGRVFATIDTGRVEVIVCDNASDPETQRELDRLQTIYSKIRIDRSATNAGFTAAVNRGIALATPGNDVLILNNDAIVMAGWIDEMIAVLEANPGAGIVASQQVLLPGTHTIVDHAPFANPNFEIDVNLSAHHDNVARGGVRPDGSIELTFVPFFCVLIARAALDAVGPLDERLGPHYGSDSLFCYATREIAGLSVLYAPHAKVYHLLQRSTKALRSADPAVFDRFLIEGRYEPYAWSSGSSPGGHIVLTDPRR